MEFYLENGDTGERLPLQPKDNATYEPENLGFAENRSYSEVEYGFFGITQHSFTQPSLNGLILFWDDDERQQYKAYREFVDWVQKVNNLQIVYIPYSDSEELYMDVMLDELGIPNPILYGPLECPITLTGTSPYHKKNPLTFLFRTQESANPMKFTFKFPFQFSDSGARDAQVFTPTGHFPAAMELTVNGPVSNIYFKCEDAVTGEVIGVLDLSGVSVAAGDHIYYSSRPNADGVWKVSGNTRTDLVESLNENVANFFTLPAGKSVRATLTADTAAGTEVTHALQVHEYFKG